MTGNVKKGGFGEGMTPFSKYIPIKNTSQLIESIDDPNGEEQVPLYRLKSIGKGGKTYGDKMNDGTENKHRYAGLGEGIVGGADTYYLDFKIGPKGDNGNFTHELYTANKELALNAKISERFLNIMMIKESKKRYDEIIGAKTEEKTEEKTGGKKRRTKKRKSMKKKQRKTKRRKSLKKRKSIKKRKA